MQNGTLVARENLSYYPVNTSSPNGYYVVQMMGPNGTVNNWMPFFFAPKDSKFFSTQLKEYLNGNRTFEMVTEDVGQPEEPNTPTVIILTILGLSINLLAFTVILCTELIRTNANKYICTMVFADFLYLLAALASILGARTYCFWSCAFIEFIGNSAVFMSSMCVVLLTMERFLAITCPLEHMQMDFNRWRIILFVISPLVIWELFIAFFTMLDNSNNIYNIRVENVIKCSYSNHAPFAGLGSIMSNSFHFLLPLICVVFLNIVIAFKVHNLSGINFLHGPLAQQQAPRSRPQAMEMRRRRVAPAGGTTTNTTPSSPTSPDSRRGQPISVPMVLFLIPAIYVLLNSPFYAHRFLKYGMRDIDGVDMEVPRVLYWTAYYMFMANFASNAIIYALASKSFRRTLYGIWRRQLKNISSQGGNTYSTTQGTFGTDRSTRRY